MMHNVNYTKVHNNFNYHLVIMQNDSINLIDSFIHHLLSQVDTEIDLTILINNLPTYTSQSILSLISSITSTSFIRPPVQRGLVEDDLIAIAKIQKDSLMPKDLSQQKVRVQSPRRSSPKSSASSMRKLAFKKRESSNLVQKLQSVSFTQKESKQRQSSIYQPLNSQEHNEQEEIIVDSLRYKAQTRLQQLQHQNKVTQQKQKIFQSKLNDLNHLIKQDPKAAITYGYDAEAIRSNLEEYENLHVNMTRTGIGFGSKRVKEGVKLYAPQQTRIEIRQKGSKSFKQQSNATIKPLEMPFFAMKALEESQYKNLKLEQYKKCFGRRYNRLDKRTHTLDMNTTTKTLQRQQIVNKDIKDDSNNNVSNKAVKEKTTNRKLALPKLNGKYKVLDRYEE